jgi:hypothetical protein
LLSLLPAAIFVHPAQYLDPGTGSLIIQIVLAALLGIGVTTRLFWKKIRTHFGKNVPVTTEIDAEQDDD